MAVKGTWTTGSPPNHAPTILGALAIVALVVLGLANHADEEAPAPAASPSASAAAPPSPTAPVVRTSVPAAIPRRT
jgi:hypothetical protein